nr:zinc ABC transporter substrate-binding protein [Sediminivirga luteola]
MSRTRTHDGRRRRRPAVVLGAAVSTLALVAGCGSGQGGDAGQGDSGALQVVTSTDVYADIVSTIGGDLVEVTPIIDDPTIDPHSYEATAQDQLVLSRADAVVINGGGYDEFVEMMLAAADSQPPVVSAVEVSGLEGAGEAGHGHEHGDEAGDEHGHEHGDEAGDEHSHDHDEHSHDHDDHEHGDGAGDEHDHEHVGEHNHDEHAHDHGAFNEHVWYSIPAMENLTAAVAEELIALLPDDADAIQANAEALTGELETLHERLHGIEGEHAGTVVGVTEPVALYLFEDMGLENAVPEDFIYAVESGGDVPPLVLRDALETAQSGDLQLLAINTQSAGPEAEDLRRAAEEAGTPVVEVVETLPEGLSYVSWMNDVIASVEDALG